jgi:hypothetical protein
MVSYAFGVEQSNEGEFILADALMLTSVKAQENTNLS